MLPLDDVGKLKIKEQKGRGIHQRSQTGHSEDIMYSDVVKRYVVDAAKIEGYKARMDL
jgi:hypothetical protein